MHLYLAAALSDSYTTCFNDLPGFVSAFQIVDKALEEPKYSSLYAQLCLRLAEDAPNFDGTSPDIQTPQKQSTVSLTDVLLQNILFSL